ncbi:aspartate/glutamate racemase family protein [Moorella sulfitireducens]|uniref:aspartate/glutamate racemase family protein n=1 Tax=Neomoorella sulfitireducens TaxID=2972948 RepID=UPI0021AC0D74|nr:aspartate/glutamate racemase family protein [Moorella sulfitireducens]
MAIVKLMLINPNTNAQMTRTIEESALLCKSSTTEIKAVTNSTGPVSIEGHVDEMVSTPGVLEIIMGAREIYDAFIIACYSNHPAINAARELTAKPVIGICEASLLTACLLGHRFSIVTTSPRWQPMLEEAVRVFGLEARCASVRSSGLAVLDLERLGAAEVEDVLERESRKAIAEDGAEVICLGCAGMAGFSQRLRQSLGVPVVDGVASAVKMAEGLYALGLQTSKVGMFRPLEPRKVINMNGPMLEAYG